MIDHFTHWVNSLCIELHDFWDADRLRHKAKARKNHTLHLVQL